MKKIFYLKNCSTCKKILSEIPSKEWEIQELKSQPITEKQLDELRSRVKSYEELFNKRSTQIKKREIEYKNWDDEAFKGLILNHYSFLKRPIIISDDVLFIGNSKETQNAIQAYFKQKIDS